jgi:hypothetical protein
MVDLSVFQVDMISHDVYNLPAIYADESWCVIYCNYLVGSLTNNLEIAWDTNDSPKIMIALVVDTVFKILFLAHLHALLAVIWK